ncbi:acyltransferase family protein [Collinsella aerofaciens]|uniref:acyltransferase family protein n=1 Tax=Collinsella aerofaciens TaxID=74426 RepID=UPI0021B1B016|nr:acyltransferase [Collinsella aerofaciens]MCT6782653.1 acyltransferase [Collinsella aerofaciens]
MKKTVYPWLDLLKLIMAVSVVAVHTNPLYGFDAPFASRVLNVLESISVPFFFIASSFLCFRGLCVAQFQDRTSTGSCRARSTISKFVWLYCAWFIAYIPIDCLGYWLDGTSLLKAAVLEVRGFFLLGEGRFSWPLWYLLASVVGFILVYAMLRKGMSSRRILGASFLFLLGGFGLSLLLKWEGAPVAISLPVKIYSLTFGNTRNGLFEGFFYIALGMYFGMNLESVKKIGVSTISTAIAIGALGCVLISSDQHLLFCALVSGGIVLLSMRGGVQSQVPIFTRMRQASTVIYLTHIVFIALYVFEICGSRQSDVTSNSDVNHLALFCFTVVASLLTSAGVIALSKRSSVIKKVFAV